MKALRIKTLANTDKIYTVIQARTEGKDTIKLQAVGPVANRDYGLSATIAKKDAPGLYAWLVEAEKPVTKIVEIVVDPVVLDVDDLYDTES
jgi:hypothetical protein